MLKALVLLAVLASVANALVCPAGYCSTVRCEAMDGCPEGQKVRRNGSFCGCCDTCVTILGEGEECETEGELRGSIITSECGKMLTCDRETGRCIKKKVKFH